MEIEQAQRLWYLLPEEGVWGVWGVTSKADGSVCETGVEDVHEGGERGTGDPAGCIHYSPQSVPAGGRAGSIPHSAAASEDALNSTPVEGATL